MKCRHCRHQTSLTAGTIFAYSTLSLTAWFLAMYFLTRQKHAIAALALKRHFGVSYPMEWSIKHKLLQVMLERDAERQPTGVIEIDHVSRGGEVHGEIPGRGSPNKTPFIAAVAKNHAGHPIALRMRVVDRDRAGCMGRQVHPPRQQRRRRRSRLFSRHRRCRHRAPGAGERQRCGRRRVARA
jgi:hypothetical protein